MAEAELLASNAADADVLADLGLSYEPELSRDLGLLGSFAVSFSVVSVLTGLTGLYTLGYANGGPVAIIWGWPLCVLMNLTVAAGMAEICSAYPVANIYFW